MGPNLGDFILDFGDRSGVGGGRVGGSGSRSKSGGCHMEGWGSPTGVSLVVPLTWTAHSGAALALPSEVLAALTGTGPLGGWLLFLLPAATTCLHATVLTCCITSLRASLDHVDLNLETNAAGCGSASRRDSIAVSRPWSPSAYTSAPPLSQGCMALASMSAACHCSRGSLAGSLPFDTPLGPRVPTSAP
jgi:hypothetical protein